MKKKFLSKTTILKKIKKYEKNEIMNKISAHK